MEGDGLLKKGVCYVCVPGETLEERLRAARDAGYQGIELTFAPSGGGPLAYDADRSRVGEVGARIRAAGLEAPSLMGGGALAGASLLDPGPEVRARGVAHLQVGLQRAAWLGADTLLIAPGQVAAEVGYDEAFDGLVAALRALVPACEATSVEVAVENVWNRFLVSPRDMGQLVDAVGHPLVGAYFDVGNCLLWSHAEQWVRSLGARIRRVHVKDFRRSVGTGAGFCQLLDGDANYPAVMAALRHAGYDGHLTSEVSGDIMETSRRLDRILAMA